MSKAKAVGGKPYTYNPHPFEPWDSNTICDVTGFRVKMSDVQRRWEGFYVIPAAWHPRQPQDFPVVPIKQHIYYNSRNEQVRPSEDIDSPFEGGFSSGFSTGFDVGQIV